MHHTTLNYRRVEFTLFDPKNKRALNALLPEAFVQQIEALWNGENSSLLGLGEWELIKAAQRAGRPISPQDHMLRMQFWLEYHSQQENPDYHYPSLNMSKVVGKAVAKETFYRHIITDPHKLAFIITPPTAYLDALEYALSGMLNRVTEILSLPLVHASGEINLELITRTQRLVETLLRYRVNGNGAMVNPPMDGRRPGQRMSDKKIEEARPAESSVEKAARLQFEVDQMKADRVNQIGGEPSAEG